MLVIFSSLQVFYVFFQTVAFYYSTDLQVQNHIETKFKQEYLFELCNKD